METTMPSARTQEERVFALLAHLSFFLFAILGPLVLWLVQRGKSAYASFQAFQALVMHLFSMVLVCMTLMLYFFGLFGGLMGIIGGGAAHEPGSQVAGGCLLALAVVVFLAVMGIQLVLMVFAIVAAIRTGQGDDYRYPWIGRVAYRWWSALESTRPDGTIIESARNGAE